MSSSSDSHVCLPLKYFAVGEKEISVFLLMKTKAGPSFGEFNLF